MEYQEYLERLARHRILPLRGEINGKKQDELCAALEMLDLESSAPITIRIDSRGGAHYPAGFLMDAIRFARSRIDGVVTGLAHSAAFCILQVCDRRLAYPRASLLFHSIRTNGVESGPGEEEIEADRQIASAREGTKEIFQLIVDRSGQKLEDVVEWARLEREWTAREALEHRFIDEILTPPKKEVSLPT